MNEYFKNLEKVEYVITYACTGKCKHCSEGEHSSCGEYIDPIVASNALKTIAANYKLKTVMTFGGEPLLFPEVVCKIHTTAKKFEIPHRQIITNGYFSKDVKRINEVVYQLYESGVNDLRLSVDAFHQETIPVEIVKLFALAAKNASIPIKTQPAWLVSRDDKNPYNEKTMSILREFNELGIEQSEGNVIFAKGNALKYFAEYFNEKTVENPYIEDPYNVRCISFAPNGDVLNGNVLRQSISEIISNYIPF